MYQAVSGFRSKPEAPSAIQRRGRLLLFQVDICKERAAQRDKRVSLILGLYVAVFGSTKCKTNVAEENTLNKCNVYSFKGPGHLDGLVRNMQREQETYMVGNGSPQKLLKGSGVLRGVGNARIL